MAFLLPAVPYILGGALALLAVGCGGSSNADAGRDTPADTNPNPSGSGSAAPLPSATLVAPQPSLTSMVATRLSAPEPAIDVGSPTAPQLTIFAGADDAARARSWATIQALTVGRVADGSRGFFRELHQFYPGGTPANAIEQAVSLIGSRDITFSYSFNGTASGPVSLSQRDAVGAFIGWLAHAPLDDLRARTHLPNRPDGTAVPDLTDDQLRALQAEAVRLSTRTGDAGAPNPADVPRPAVSAPRPPRTGGSGRPAVRNPTGPDIFY